MILFKLSIFIAQLVHVIILCSENDYVASNHTNSLHICSSVNISTDITHVWKDYVPYAIISIFRKIRSNLLHIFSHLSFRHICNRPFKHSESIKGTLLSEPCHSLQFHPRSNIKTLWIIVVNEIFVINITIGQAYVILTPECDDYISVFDNGTKPSDLDTFCGHVYMESLYTTSNKAVIKFKSTMSNAPNTPFVELSYQVHSKGTVYMKRRTSIDKSIHKFKPNILTEHSLKYDINILDIMV